MALRPVGIRRAVALPVSLCCLLAVQNTVAPLAAQTQSVSRLIIKPEKGMGAKNYFGRVATQPIVIQVTAETGKPVAQAQVVFDLPEKGASGVFGTAGRRLSQLTDENGRAQAAGLLPKNATGKFDINVTVSHKRYPAEARISIEQENVVDISSLRLEVLTGQGDLNNICKKDQVREPAVVVNDNRGRPVVGAEVTFRLPDSPPGGIFRDHGRALRRESDEKGQAVGGKLIPEKTGRFSIRVAASLTREVLPAETVIVQQNVKKGCFPTALVLALVAGGGAAGAASQLMNKGPIIKNGPPPVAVVINPGQPSFGAPR